MSTVLRARGVDFKVEEYLGESTLTACAIMVKGERVFSHESSNERTHSYSSVSIVASEAGFDDFKNQVTETIVFLQTNYEQLKKLVSWPGVEYVNLDFGIARRDVAVQCDYLPADLVRLAGSLGLGIELSQYPIMDNDAEET